MNPGAIIAICKRAGLAGVTADSQTIRSLEVGLNARLPMQYRLLLEKVGPIQFGMVCFYSPQHVLAYAASIWNMSKLTSNFWPAVPVARWGNHGDDSGFLRRETAFGDEVFLLDHEKEWYTDRDTHWGEWRAKDLGDFIESGLRDSTQRVMRSVAAESSTTG